MVVESDGIISRWSDQLNSTIEDVVVLEQDYINDVRFFYVEDVDVTDLAQRRKGDIMRHETHKPYTNTISHNKHL